MRLELEWPGPGRRQSAARRLVVVIVRAPEGRGGRLSATGCRAGAGAGAAAGARAIAGAVRAVTRGGRRDAKYSRGWRRLGLREHWCAQMEPLKVGGWRVSDCSGSTTHFIFWGRSFGRAASDEKATHKDAMRRAGDDRCEPDCKWVELGQQEDSKGRPKKRSDDRSN